MAQLFFIQGAPKAPQRKTKVLTQPPNRKQKYYPLRTFENKSITL